MLTQNLSPQQIEAVNAIDEDVEIIASHIRVKRRSKAKALTGGVD